MSSEMSVLFYPATRHTPQDVVFAVRYVSWCPRWASTEEGTQVRVEISELRAVLYALNNEFGLKQHFFPVTILSCSLRFMTGYAVQRVPAIYCKTHFCANIHNRNSYTSLPRNVKENTGRLPICTHPNVSNPDGTHGTHGDSW
jgi:hypothetical protein